jgi:hypothetical protein
LSFIKPNALDDEMKNNWHRALAVCIRFRI